MQQEFHGSQTGKSLKNTVRSMRPNDQPADLGNTNNSDDFDEVNNRTMDY